MVKAGRTPVQPPHGQLLVAGHAQLADHKHIRGACRAWATRKGNRHSAARQRQHRDIWRLA